MKEYEDNSDWPFILETPDDDVSFWPFNNVGCLVRFVNAATLLVGLFITALILMLIFGAVSLFVFGEPLW